MKKPDSYRSLLPLTLMAAMAGCTPQDLDQSLTGFKDRVGFVTDEDPSGGNEQGIIMNSSENTFPPQLSHSDKKEGDFPSDPPPLLEESLYSTAPGWTMQEEVPTSNGVYPSAWLGHNLTYISVAHEVGQDPLVAHSIVHIQEATASGCPYALIEDGAIYWPFVSETTAQAADPTYHGIGTSLCGLGSYGYDPTTGLNNPNELWFRSTVAAPLSVYDDLGNLTWTIPGSGLVRLERPDPSTPWNQSQITEVRDSYWNVGGSPTDHVVGIARAFPDDDPTDGIDLLSTNYPSPYSNAYQFSCGVFTMNPNGTMTALNSVFSPQATLPVNCQDPFWDGTFAADGSPNILAGIFATNNWGGPWNQTLVKYPLSNPDLYEEIMTSPLNRRGVYGSADPCTGSIWVMQPEPINGLRIPHLVFPTLDGPPDPDCWAGDDDDSAIDDDDDSAVGDDDSAVGDDDSAIGDDDSAVGDDDSAIGDDDSAIGDDDVVADDDDSAIGDDDVVADDDDSAIGDDDVVADDDDSAIGDDDSAIGDDDSAIGDDDSAIGDDDSAIGDDDSAIGDDDSAIGDDDSAIGDDDSAIGDDDVVADDDDSAIGDDDVVADDDDSAIGDDDVVADDDDEATPPGPGEGCASSCDEAESNSSPESSLAALMLMVALIRRRTETVVE